MSEKTSDTYAYCVRNALRRKPTLIVVGEARQKATIEAACEAALTGTVSVRHYDDKKIEWVYDGTKGE